MRTKKAIDVLTAMRDNSVIAKRLLKYKNRNAPHLNEAFRINNEEIEALNLAIESLQK